VPVSPSLLFVLDNRGGEERRESYGAAICAAAVKNISFCYNLSKGLFSSYILTSVLQGLNMFEVSTLGQPFEVIKTQLAANRGQSMAAALSAIYSRGGVLGFFQGLIPWAWIEASTKGAVLLFTASEFEYRAKAAGASPFLVRFCCLV
jgi:hypothetical protein